MAKRTAFVVCHDGERKVAAWTAHELRREMLAVASAARQHFRRDPALVSASSDADYRNSGFHRSHLVPAADVAWSAEGLRESYLLSNAVPQVAQLNLSGWRRIENDIRKLTEQNDAVQVMTGTLFDCDNVRRIGAGGVAVPCATFKVVLAMRGGRRTAYAVILKNEAGGVRETVSVREVERRSGLDFFGTLSQAEQDEIETSSVALR
ncbi:MAG: DNA/RNA non-specific endonuclease [Acidobacteria bacterium]|nr:DNA/RNA non-specific endonuclease [Acidobacteriota bacterium]